MADEMLGEFEGQAVTEAAVEVRNAGGGLNDALAVDPIVKQISDTVFVVLQCDVTAINYKPVKGAEDELRRIHVLRATDAAVIEPGTAGSASLEKAVNAQRARIQKWRDERQGVTPMFPDERAS